MSKFNDKAVALKYRKERDKAPVIVAAGKGQIAQKIIKIADQKGVPIYKDTNAATILSQLAVGSYIPSELYSLIANIYVCILDMADSLKAKNYQQVDLVVDKGEPEEAEASPKEGKQGAQGKPSEEQSGQSE